MVFSTQCTVHIVSVSCLSMAYVSVFVLFPYSVLNAHNIIAIKTKSHPDDPQKLFAVYPLFRFPGICMESSSRQEDLAAAITQQSKFSAWLGKTMRAAAGSSVANVGNQ